MTPTNLPDLYARVVAKRPELAVEGLERYGTHDMPVDVWLHFGTLAEDSTAAALILARWVEALPVHHVLAQVLENKWEVYELGIGGDYQFSGRDYTATPIEALAAFYLGQESAC